MQRKCSYTRSHLSSSQREIYSAIKKNEVMSFVGKWVKLEMIILSEISQTHEDKYHKLPLIFGDSIHTLMHITHAHKHIPPHMV